MALLDLLGRRWLLRVLWELRETPATFRDLRERCDGVSPTVLSGRLRELRDAGIVDLDESGYRPTPHGDALVRALGPVHDWAVAWGRRVRPSSE